VKWNDRALTRQFEAEARGLEAMGAASTGLVVPRVAAYLDGSPGESYLALEYIPPGARARDFDEQLGHGLAVLHRCTTTRGFGFDVDGACGASPQRNTFTPSWISFFREHRLGAQIEFARDRGMPQRDLTILEELAHRLAEWTADGEAPALIHGDLWAGNVFAATDGRPVLVDPAAYFADREAEFGMMRLFGGFSPRVYDAYSESSPLREGAERRIPLYSLFHVLNHYAIFGGSYGAQAIASARDLLGH
jgi:protein-ribulosamine 3-kinase